MLNTDDKTERQICADMYKVVKEGGKSRDEGTVCPYHANTVEYFLHTQGWLTRDLQLALCKAKPTYGEEQLRCGNITQEQVK